MAYNFVCREHKDKKDVMIFCIKNCFDVHYIKLYTIILTRTKTKIEVVCIKYVLTQKGSKTVHFGISSLLANIDKIICFSYCLARTDNMASRSPYNSCLPVAQTALRLSAWQFFCSRLSPR